MNESNEKIGELVAKLTYKDPITDEEFEGVIDILAQYLLFGTPWESTMLNNPKVRRKIPILADMPLMCKADDCPYAPKCPILKSIIKPSERMRLVGTECRADKIYAIEEFAAFVRDLKIDPEQTTDIINVASLIRLLILKRRIDWSLAIDGIMDREPGIIDQRTGQMYFRNVVHPLLKTSESLEKQVAVLQKQLMADRQARAALAASQGKSADFLSDLFSGNYQKALEENALSNTVDAEFSEISEEIEQ